MSAYDIYLRRRNGTDTGWEDVVISGKDFAAGNFSRLNPKPVEIAASDLPAKDIPGQTEDTRPKGLPLTGGTRVDQPVEQPIHTQIATGAPSQKDRDEVLKLQQTKAVVNPAKPSVSEQAKRDGAVESQDHKTHISQAEAAKLPDNLKNKVVPDPTKSGGPSTSQNLQIKKPGQQEHTPPGQHTAQHDVPTTGNR